MLFTSHEVDIKIAETCVKLVRYAINYWHIADMAIFSVSDFQIWLMILNYGTGVPLVWPSDEIIIK